VILVALTMDINC